MYKTITMAGHDTNTFKTTGNSFGAKVWAKVKIINILVHKMTLLPPI